MMSPDEPDCTAPVRPERLAFEAALREWARPDVHAFPEIFEAAARSMLRCALPTRTARPRGKRDLIRAATDDFHYARRGCISPEEWEQVGAALVESGALIPWQVDLGDGSPPQTVGYTRADSALASQEEAR
jgi:hypothetical protein